MNVAGDEMAPAAAFYMPEMATFLNRHIYGTFTPPLTEGRGLMAKNVKAIVVEPKKFNVVSKSRKKSWWLTATSGDNFANDFPKENSGLFTHYFLKALNGEKGVDDNDDGLITMREAFNWTKKEVQDVSAKALGRLQVPELIGEGDIILTMPR